MFAPMIAPQRRRGNPLTSQGYTHGVLTEAIPMRLSPKMFIEFAALVELYNDEVSAAKAAESEGGSAVTPAEMFGIAIAVGGPLLKLLFIPSLPDETIDAAAAAVGRNVAALSAVRAKAAKVLNRVEAGAGGLMAWLRDS